MTAVAVLGAGLMGAQIGCEYALGGHSVVFVTRDPARGRERVTEALELVTRYGLADLAAVRAATRRIAYRDACEGDEPVELVVESLPEDREVKAGVLRTAAAWRPDATIATNSSSIPASELGVLAGVEDRIVTAHYWNPPLLMPLVEVLGGPDTATRRTRQVVEVLTGLGKRVVLLGAESPGLLWNRLQLALLREALWVVEQGVATPEQVDEVMRDGLARRWRLTGPFETVALGGASLFDAIASNLFPQLSAAEEPSGFGPHVGTDVEALAELRRHRDEALARELRG